MDSGVKILSGTLIVGWRTFAFLLSCMIIRPEFRRNRKENPYELQLQFASGNVFHGLLRTKRTSISTVTCTDVPRSLSQMYGQLCTQRRNPKDQPFVRIRFKSDYLLPLTDTATQTLSPFIMPAVRLVWIRPSAYRNPHIEDPALAHSSMRIKYSEFGASHLRIRSVSHGKRKLERLSYLYCRDCVGSTAIKTSDCLR